MEPPRHVVLFTLHAYASWMPDREQGFYQNRNGLRATNASEASRYRARQKQDEVAFTIEMQLALIERLREASRCQQWHLFAVATDEAHLHFLTAWDDDREPVRIQSNAKESLTRELNERFGNRRWFTRNGHDRRVRSEEHFVHLRDVYLPSHRGVCWDRRDQ